MESTKSKSQVREFLGLVRTLEHWTPGITASSKLLRGLANKDTCFIWTSDHEQEFSRVKEVITDISVLSAFDPDLPLHLMCDASREGGLGYVLTEPRDDRINILQCGLTTLSSAQMGYSIMELEILSMVWALDK